MVGSDAAGVLMYFYCSLDENLILLAIGKGNVVDYYQLTISHQYHNIDY